MQTRYLAGALFLLALAACSTRNTRTVTVTPQGDTIITHGDRPLAQVAGTLKSGTKIEAVLQEEVSSANHKPGDEVRATLTEEVKDVNGQVLFPAGTEAQVRITQLRAPADDRDNGDVGFAVMSLKKDGRTYDVTSSADPSSYQVKNRGAFDDKGNIAIGAGAGAVVGGLITGSVKGAVVGGLLGGGAGAVYNSQTGKRDVVVRSGTKLEFKLDQPVVVMVS
ncbi:MAG: hypothetical protein HY700_11190 [Gemmatimonadetes bacterium]|nr:hypothetical protein [Gemmatimonadota bacterium]